MYQASIHAIQTMLEAGIPADTVTAAIALIHTQFSEETPLATRSDQTRQLAGDFVDLWRMEGDAALGTFEGLLIK